MTDMDSLNYFAAHAPMPNAAEASSVLGWRCRESVLIPDSANAPDEYSEWVKLPRFDELWKKLTNTERAKVCANFQFIYAQEMLRVSKNALKQLNEANL